MTKAKQALHLQAENCMQGQCKLAHILQPSQIKIILKFISVVLEGNSVEVLTVSLNITVNVRLVHIR